MKNSFFWSSLILCLTIILSCSDEDAVIPQPPSQGSAQKTQAPAPPVDRIEFTLPQTLACTNILIDASRDGGAWWYPQWLDFNAAADHQGKQLASLLRAKGFRVDEMPRTRTISDDVLKNYSVVIRTSGDNYSTEELAAYSKRIEEGITLILLSDHHKFAYTDKLAEMLGVTFTGIVDGKISRFEDNPFTRNMKPIDYMVGSFISNAEENPNIIPVGWLSDNTVVMAKYSHPTSEIFLMGDVNTFEFNPQPFVENLSSWITGNCRQN